MLHGGMLLPIIIDGFLLSRLPLRMKQFILPETFAFIYVLWTIIHSFSGIGNPYADAGEQNDDAIYDVLAWKNKTIGAVILTLVLLFVVSPILFLFCRVISRIPPRRLCEEGAGQHCENGAAADSQVPLL
mmetsp:Transcript_2968/g.4673  ORF Transcript_2968/g.4673 Transcript_2968/m.4673 type:complete len:130 (+) Transcript_2968:124-513(+)